MPAPRLWPILTEADRAALQRILDRGVLSGAGAPEMKALEEEFAASLGSRFCLATNSGTAALHIALAAAGVGAGDEVIVPALSFIATAQAVLHQGATPVFGDVDPVTYNIDPGDVAARITSRPRAIVPVHLHGLPADMDAINALVRQAGVVLIEDAAQAHGALYRGRRAGCLPDRTCPAAAPCRRGCGAHRCCRLPRDGLPHDLEFHPYRERGVAPPCGAGMPGGWVSSACPLHAGRTHGRER